MNPNVFSGKTNVSFLNFVDLASEAVGGKALYTNDDFFASMDNLIKVSEPVFIVDKYTEQGKWMDGWESRRKRVPGHDHCIVKLGIPGEIAGIDIDTAFFTGNHPEYAELKAIEASENASVEELSKANWVTLVSKSQLQGGSHNYFGIQNTSRFTHVKLNIYPDGGVARLRVYGKARPDFSKMKGSIDLAALVNGGKAITSSDQFFGSKDNLILPGRAQNMGGGWETRRSRGPHEDWIIVRLATKGKIQKIDVDTHFYKGNYPDACSIAVAELPHDLLPCDFRDQKIEWKEILPKTKLQADRQHVFEKELNAALKGTAVNYVKLTIYPDGGISRLRVWGEPSNS